MAIFSVDVEAGYDTIRSLLDAPGSDPNVLDYTDANCLLHLVWAPNAEVGTLLCAYRHTLQICVTATKLLLEKGGNPTLEYEQVEIGSWGRD